MRTIITTSILRFFFLIIFRRIFFLKSPCIALFLPSENSQDSCIILIHGLGRTGLSMLVPAFFLRLKSYNVFIYDYVSGRSELSEHSVLLSDFFVHLKRTGFKNISFITHSLGGILLRVCCANFPDIFPEGRTVMLAPPNRGSKAADFFSKIYPISKLFLPLCEIRRTKTALVNSLPPPPFEHAVIAGSLDGKVHPDEAKTESMKDFCIVKAHHSFIMNRPDVLRASLAFLRTGKFGTG